VTRLQYSVTGQGQAMGGAGPWKGLKNKEGKVPHPILNQVGLTVLGLTCPFKWPKRGLWLKGVRNLPGCSDQKGPRCLTASCHPQ
jgi:hypothetical protein